MEILINKNIKIPRLIICDYYDSLVNEVDIKAEKLLLNRELDGSEINRINYIRNGFIKKIQDVQSKCLNKYNEAFAESGGDESCLIKEDILMKDLFSSYFCFFISYIGLFGFKLIITDWYVGDGFIESIGYVFFL